MRSFAAVKTVSSMNPEFTSPMEVNVLVIAGKCRLCAVDTLDTSFDIFSTCGLQNKIRKYLQITVSLCGKAATP